MWATIAKVGGSLLAGLGIDWAWDSYTENKKESEQMKKQANWGKWLLIGACVVYGFSLMKKK